MSTYLGQRIPIVNGGQVKGGVVAILAALLPPHSPSSPPPTLVFASPHSVHHPHPIRLPSFNRMSGLLQWRNCICLFVNLRASRYDNQFSHSHRGDGCMRLTWFAQASTKADSAIVQRLKGAREGGGGGMGECRNAGEGVEEGGAVVLLFCREVGSPYRYYGRLGYEAMEASTRPMRFTWRLLDWDRLRQLDEESRSEQHSP